MRRPAGRRDNAAAHFVRRDQLARQSFVLRQGLVVFVSPRPSGPAEGFDALAVSPMIPEIFPAAEQDKQDQTISDVPDASAHALNFS